jgi:hypothetical protein
VRQSSPRNGGSTDDSVNYDKGEELQCQGADKRCRLRERELSNALEWNKGVARERERRGPLVAFLY